MKKYLLQVTCVLAFSAVSCWADVLHGYCAGTLQCIDNGTNSPTTNNPPTGFGFTINGGATGTLLIDILVPNNSDPNPSQWSFDLIGTLNGTASLFSATPWTHGFLATYLGFNASPNNPVGAFLGPCAPTSTTCTLDVDPGAAGFYVYQASFLNATLQSVPNPNTSPLESFDPNDPALPIGSFITAFLNKGTNAPDWVATANSNAIFVDAAPTNHDDILPTPEPSSVILLGFSLLGFAFFIRKKARKRA